MPLRRFFVPRSRIHDREASLPPDQAHHLTHVLRIGAGDQVEIFDGVGGVYLGTVEVDGKEVRATGLTPVQAAASPADRRIVLAAALIKSEKLEWVIQKATELGMDEFVPLETSRSNIKIADDRRVSRLTRWRTIAAEAAKQSRRDSVPTIHEISTFAGFVSGDPFPGFARYLCYEQSTAAWNQDFLGTGAAILCIGPEGGWDPAEVGMAVGAGFRDFSLGCRTLRSETAALAALTLFKLRLSPSGVRTNT